MHDYITPSFELREKYDPYIKQCCEQLITTEQPHQLNAMQTEIMHKVVQKAADDHPELSIEQLDRVYEWVSDRITHWILKLLETNNDIKPDSFNHL